MADRVIPTLLATALMAMSTAQVASAQPQAAPMRPARSNACFYARNVDSFAAVDDTTVNLRVSVGEIFQLKLFAPCTDLDFSQRIGLRSRGASAFVCEGRANDIELTTRSPAGPSRCLVTWVRKLSADEIAALPRRQRP
jgi:hypothetical protein